MKNKILITVFVVIEIVLISILISNTIFINSLKNKIVALEIKTLTPKEYCEKILGGKYSSFYDFVRKNDGLEGLARVKETTGEDVINCTVPRGLDIDPKYYHLEGTEWIRDWDGPNVDIFGF